MRNLNLEMATGTAALGTGGLDQGSLLDRGHHQPMRRARPLGPWVVICKRRVQAFISLSNIDEKFLVLPSRQRGPPGPARGLELSGRKCDETEIFWWQVRLLIGHV